MNAHREPEDTGQRSLLERVALLGRALAHPLRLELLDHLAQAERSVDDLARGTGARLSTTSAHLQVLRASHLVATRRAGTRVYYRLAGDDVLRLLVELRTVAAARVPDFLQAASHYLGDDVATVDERELERRARAGDVTLLDVRSEAEYRAGHIPGAVSVPLERLDQRLDGLPEGAEVIAYCRGPHSALSHLAVRRLGERGVRASRLAAGFPEWRLAGHPVHAGAEPGAWPPAGHDAADAAPPPGP